MTPVKGQKVQIRFNNGVFFDAIIESWSDQKSVVRTIDGGDTVIIQKTLQDVMLVKIFNQPVAVVEPRDMNEEFETLKEQPKNENNLKRMAELKDTLNKLEREEVLKKATSFTPSGLRQVTYGVPKNLKPAAFTEDTRVSSEQFNNALISLFKNDY